MSEHSFSEMRAAMVSNQLRTNAVNDVHILDAMKAIPRERFVPQERATLAYVDVAIPLGNGRSLNPPMATGRLLTEAQVTADDRVLLIGAATGYGAAVIAQIAAHVDAVEEDDALFAAAQTALGDDEAISLHKAPLADGYADGGPYDLIVIDGQVAKVPDSLAVQLREGGRLVTGLNDGGVGRLARGVKAGGALSLVPFADADSVALPGFGLAPGFRF